MLKFYAHISISVYFLPERTEEVCVREEFKASCGYSEVVLITSASFGHLYHGRCISRDFGHFGCTSDVTRFVDGRCSGKRSCIIPLTDSEFEKAEPDCANGLRTFLEAKYICVKGW